MMILMFWNRNFFPIRFRPRFYDDNDDYYDKKNNYATPCDIIPSKKQSTCIFAKQIKHTIFGVYNKKSVFYAKNVHRVYFDCQTFWKEASQLLSALT